MAKADLEIIRGLAQAAGNLYDGALDNDGKPLTIGLNREDLPDIMSIDIVYWRVQFSIIRLVD